VTDDDLRARIEQAIRAYVDGATQAIPPEADDLALLGQAVRDFVTAGGKRMRPLFCCWGHVAAGGELDDRIVTAAGALEFVHAAALMHDDVIDSSDTRRGAPTAHRRFAELHRGAGWSGAADEFGRAAAILLGDLTLVWSDAMLTDSGFSATELAIALPVWNAMRAEVMWGQYLDVVEQSRATSSVESALRVLHYKTAKYTVERPLHLGAALAGAGLRTLEQLSAYGIPLGEAYQLRDDVLGVFGDPAVTGKPAGDDIREGKRTVLVAFALEAADAEGRALLSAALGDRDLDAATVDRVRDVVADSGALARAEALIDDRVQTARAAVRDAALPAEAAAALERLAVAVTDRSS
jgi:geranylgeranyl diphosphate synthase type I